MTVFCDIILMDIRAHEDKDLVLLQIKVVKCNNEGIDNVRILVYYCNNSETEIVRPMLIKYIETSLPNHLATWKNK